MPTFEDFLLRLATYAQSQTPQLTDLQPGSITRSFFEAMAAQLEMLWFDAADQAEAAVSESAYRLWSFGRRTAQPASGTVLISAISPVNAAITLPAGTQMRVPGTDRIYRTTLAATFPIGATGTSLELQVVSIAPGSFYNTSSATIREFVSSPSSALNVTNPVPFTNGRDEETDDERRQRFATFIRSTHRATAESIAYAAEQATIKDGSGLVIEYVTDAQVVDQANGYARCFVANGTHQAASDALIAAVVQQVALYKAAGVTIDVLAATVIPTAVTIQVRLDASTTLAMVQATIAAAVEQVVGALKIGSILYKQQLEQVIMAVPGVIDLVTIAPSSNIDPGVAGIVVLAAGSPMVTTL